MLYDLWLVLYDLWLVFYELRLVFYDFELCFMISVVFFDFLNNSRCGFD